MTQTNADQKNIRKNVMALLGALLVCLALMAKLTVCTEKELSALDISFFAKLAVYFKETNIADIFIFAGSLVWLKKLCEKGFDLWAAVTSLVFSFLYVVCSSYKAYESMRLFTAGSFYLMMGLVVILGYAVLFYMLLAPLFEAVTGGAFMEKTGGEMLPELSSKKVFGISFLVIFFVWFVFSLMNFPGTISPDAQQQVDQVLGNLEWSAHHPPLSSIIMGGLFNFGIKIGHINFGFYLYILLHILVGAGVFSYTVKKIYELPISRWFALSALVFFALNPLWLTFAQWFEKDLLYTEIVTLAFVYIADIYMKKNCSTGDAVRLTLACLFACLLRKNGIYALLPAVIVLIIVMPKGGRKKIAVSLVIWFALCELVTSALYPALGIKSGSTREALSIPFQQTACYVRDHGDEVTEEERGAIDAVLNYDGLAENYLPTKSDPVKDEYKEDSSKLPAYFKVWGAMLLKHPETYVNAYMNQYFCYLAPMYSDLQKVATEYGKWENKRGLVHTSSKTSQLFAGLKASCEQLPLIKYLADPGVYTWLMILCIALLIKCRCFGGLVAMLPGFMNFLVCMAGPLNGSSRYALPLIAAMPLMVAVTVALCGNRNRKTEQNNV